MPRTFRRVPVVLNSGAKLEALKKRIVFNDFKGNSDIDLPQAFKDSENVYKNEVLDLVSRRSLHFRDAENNLINEWLIGGYTFKLYNNIDTHNSFVLYCVEADKSLKVKTPTTSLKGVIPNIVFSFVKNKLFIWVAGLDLYIFNFETNTYEKALPHIYIPLHEFTGNDKYIMESKSLLTSVYRVRRRVTTTNIIDDDLYNKWLNVFYNEQHIYNARINSSLQLKYLPVPSFDLKDVSQVQAGISGTNRVYLLLRNDKIYVRVNDFEERELPVMPYNIFQTVSVEDRYKLAEDGSCVFVFVETGLAKCHITREGDGTLTLSPEFRWELVTFPDLDENAYVQKFLAYHFKSYNEYAVFYKKNYCEYLFVEWGKNFFVDAITHSLANEESGHTNFFSGAKVALKMFDGKNDKEKQIFFISSDTKEAVPGSYGISASASKGPCVASVTVQSMYNKLSCCDRINLACSNSASSYIYGVREEAGSHYLVKSGDIKYGDTVYVSPYPLTLDNAFVNKNTSYRPRDIISSPVGALYYFYEYYKTNHDTSLRKVYNTRLSPGFGEHKLGEHPIRYNDVTYTLSADLYFFLWGYLYTIDSPDVLKQGEPIYAGDTVILKNTGQPPKLTNLKRQVGIVDAPPDTTLKHTEFTRLKTSPSQKEGRLLIGSPNIKFSRTAEFEDGATERATILGIVDMKNHVDLSRKSSDLFRITCVSNNKYETMVLERNTTPLYLSTRSSTSIGNVHKILTTELSEFSNVRIGDPSSSNLSFVNDLFFKNDDRVLHDGQSFVITNDNYTYRIYIPKWQGAIVRNTYYTCIDTNGKKYKGFFEGTGPLINGSKVLFKYKHHDPDAPINYGAYKPDSWTAGEPWPTNLLIEPPETWREGDPWPAGDIHIYGTINIDYMIQPLAHSKEMSCCRIGDKIYELGLQREKFVSVEYLQGLVTEGSKQSYELELRPPHKQLVSVEASYAYNYDNKSYLYTTETRYNEEKLLKDGIKDYLLYLPSKHLQTFSTEIKAIILINLTTIGVFTDTGIWYINMKTMNEGDIVYTEPLLSKIDMTLPDSYNQQACLLPDGQNMIVLTDKGVVVINPQQLLNENEQKLIYVTTSLENTYAEYYKEVPMFKMKLDDKDVPVRMSCVLHKHWVLIYKYLDNKILLLDTKDMSWWRFKIPYPIVHITKDFVISVMVLRKADPSLTSYTGEIKRMIFVDSDIYADEVVPNSFNGEYKIEETTSTVNPTAIIKRYVSPEIDWKISSNVLDLGLPNRHKCVKGIEAHFEADTNFNIKLTTNVYRQNYKKENVERIEVKAKGKSVFNKPLNFMHTLYFQYMIESDEGRYSRVPLHLTGLAINLETKETIK